jgi:hypothetical protein
MFLFVLAYLFIAMYLSNYSAVVEPTYIFNSSYDTVAFNDVCMPPVWSYVVYIHTYVRYVILINYVCYTNYLLKA